MAHAPELFTGLVLVDSIAYDSWPEPTIARLQDEAWGTRILQIDLVRGLQRGLTAGLSNTELATIALATLYAAPFEGRVGRLTYLRAARALRTHELTSRSPEIEAIKLPTARLAEALPRATLTILGGVGHFSPEEAPLDVAAVIRQASAVPSGQTGPPRS